MYVNNDKKCARVSSQRTEYVEEKPLSHQRIMQTNQDRIEGLIIGGVLRFWDRYQNDFLQTLKCMWTGPVLLYNLLKQSLQLLISDFGIST